MTEAENQKVKNSIRKDLQGIRGIAIISVLVFHFFGTVFPNGYLGVDQFFVLSGYLMCMILKGAEPNNPWSLIFNFYTKRFRRILPLYLFLIFSALIGLYSIFPETCIEINQKSASQALIFMSNRPKTGEENYFQMLSIAIDLFTHTWSLSVEIQFYLIIPIIFLFSIWIFENPKNQSIYFVILATVSFLFSQVSSPTVSFNNVFSRIWQFLIGFLVYCSPCTEGYCTLATVAEEEIAEKEEFLEKIEKIGNSVNFFSNFSALLVVLIVLAHWKIDSNILRPLVTVLTGFLIYISDQESENNFLKNRFLTYFGNISYSLYLIHWPIYAYWKLTGNGEKSGLIFCLILSILISTVIHETFEKWYLKQSLTTVGVVTVVLFLINVLMINKDRFFEIPKSLDKITPEMTLADAARLNHQWNVQDYDNLYSETCEYEGVGTPLGWCRHTGLKKSGKYRIMTIGNSWTANHANIFYQECGHLASSILQGSALGCEPLFPSHLSDMCRSNFTDFENHVNSEKPDILFIITRFMTIGDLEFKNWKFSENEMVQNFSGDPIYQVMKEQMLKFRKNVKNRIFILDAIPRVNINYIEQIVSMMWKNAPERFIDMQLVDHKLFQMARNRHAQLIKDCDGKCTLINYIPEFWNSTSKTFRFFDERGFSYFTTPSHLSPHGLEHIRHVWTDLCRTL